MHLITYYPYSKVSYDSQKNPSPLLPHERTIYTIIIASDDRNFL